MSVVGNADLLDWASREDRVELMQSTAIHNPAWLAELPSFVAILGALTVDRCGNVNSEIIDGRLVSGLGGAPDFAMGAHGSAGGKSIVALRESRPGGKPAIVARLCGQPTIGAEFVDVVVTERGRLAG
jgi:acyl-CoA hydrolase